MYYQHKVQTFFSKPSEKVYLEILRVPIVTTENWNNHIHIHINMFKKLLIELFEHQLPTKTKKKNPNIPNEQNNYDFFFSFISAISSHSEKRFLTLYFWRYKCICT